jgi:hypothetical protein
MHGNGRYHLLFANKDNRDRRYRELKANGIREVFRSSVRNQQLHPMYVEDRREGVSEADKGFGNTIYKTYFSVLYTLDWTVY